MSFEQDIKELYKKYNSEIKKYYGGGRLIFKMYFKRAQYDFLYEADTSFRVCCLPLFSDKRINKLKLTNQPKAVEQLQARARACAYLVSVLDHILTFDSTNTEQHKLLNELKYIRQQLYTITNQCIGQADEISDSIGLDRFDMAEFDFLNKTG